MSGEDDDRKKTSSKRPKGDDEDDGGGGGGKRKRSSSVGASSSANVKSYEERVKAVNVISHPLMSKKSTKRAHKLVRKASSARCVRRGVKEVVKGVRKGEKGLAVIAGDIYPIDVVSHLPVLLEEGGIPYIFVPSKQDLGAAASTKRPTSCVLVNPTKKKDFEGQDLFDSLVEEASEYDPTAIRTR